MHDHAIAGAGSAGCVLAPRLGHDPADRLRERATQPGAGA
jgi:hypothetical protein